MAKGKTFLVMDFRSEEDLRRFFTSTIKPAIEEEEQRVFDLDELPAQADARVFHVQLETKLAKRSEPHWSEAYQHKSPRKSASRTAR